MASCKLCIEIPILLIFFCFMFSDIITTNLIIYQTCYVSFGFNKTECALLGTNNVSEEIKNLEIQVQPKANLIIMGRTIIDVVISVFFSLIVGPWSNKHGRIPILISTFIGYLICYFTLILLCLLDNVSPWYYLMPSLLASLGGGVCSMLTVSFCYIADTTTESNRGIRMGILEGCFSLGSLIGTLTCSYAFNNIGYLGIYSICAGFIFIAILYIYFLVPESISNVDNENKIKDLLDKSVLIKAIKTSFKQRPNMDRPLLFLIMTLLIMYIFVIFADSGIFFLYIREKFHWSLQQYTLFSASCSFIDIFASIFILIVLHKFLKVNDMILIFIGFSVLCASSVVYGVASATWMIYLGAGLKRFSCVIGPLGRSAISKLIPPDDLGHVFAFTTSLETIVQLVSSPLYTLLYNNTIKSFSGAFNFLSASIYGINVMITSAVIFIKTKYPSEDLRLR